MKPAFANRRTQSRIDVSTPQMCWITTTPGVVRVMLRGVAAYEPIGLPAFGCSFGRETTIAGSSSATIGGWTLPKPSVCAFAEDDPAIVVSRPKLQPKAGSPIGSYAATPRSMTRTTPGVVVIQHLS